MPETNLWTGPYKIPWDDPDFSRRMLALHLAQDHDMASRRTEWIDRQVAWIHERLLGGRPARILDLGCGPGFYSHRLAGLGHRCRGVDFGPASIEYARRQGTPCEFTLGDIRCAEFGGPYDLAMILFGELNVFPPAEALAVLRKAQEAAARLIVEVQTPEAVERTGRADPSEDQLESGGLFSDRPHRCRTESQWLAGERIALQTFTITEAGGVRVYRNTTQAWPDDDLTGLLEAAGFDNVHRCADWPSNTEDLALWSCHSASR